MYLKPEEVDISDPPTIVKRIKNKDTSKFDEYVAIPDVEIDEVTERKTLAAPSWGIIKKYKNSVNKIIITPKCRSSWWFLNVNFFVKILNNK